MSEIFLRRFPPSEGVWQVSSNGGTSPHWSSDGRLFFAQGADILEVPLTTEPDVRRAPRRGSSGARRRRRQRTSGFDVSPDGNRFLIYEPSGDMTDERIVVALDWFAELRRGAGDHRSEMTRANGTPTLPPRAG